MRINLIDNSVGQPLNEKAVADLSTIANKTVAELCHRNENLLIFPYSIESATIGLASLLS